MTADQGHVTDDPMTGDATQGQGLVDDQGHPNVDCAVEGHVFGQLVESDITASLLQQRDLESSLAEVSITMLTSMTEHLLTQRMNLKF